MYLLFTIDTENLMQPPDSVMSWPGGAWGEIGGKYYGFPKIIEICDKYDVKATFFVNVFECGKIGEEILKNMCQEIRGKGHDVQLHTHPFWLYGKYYMWQFPKDVQIEIIRKGKELLKKWIGEYAIAHRAGYYGINNDTLQALRKNGILIDSSMFYGHENCKVWWSKNKIAEKDSIIEIPISVFSREDYIDFLRFKYKRSSQIVKLDINCANTYELTSVVTEAKENNIGLLNLCLHSFSFVKASEKYRKFLPDNNNIEKFERFLNFITQENSIEVITVSDFLRSYKKNRNYFSTVDMLPVVKKSETLKKKILEKIKRKIPVCAVLRKSDVEQRKERRPLK